MNSYKKYADIRDKKGLSDYRVSKDTGIATSTLSEWKNGKYVPKLNKFKILAAYFGIAVDYFTE